MNRYSEFKHWFEQEQSTIWQRIFDDNKHVIKIKKEKFVLPNLQLIIGSTIELSNRTGFRAMSLRDLSRDTGISMGALYSYIESKERLLEIILRQVLHLVEAVLAAPEAERLVPQERLRWLLRSHIFLTEIMQPWFFFAYMEAKSFDREGKRMAIESELHTEGLIAACLRAGVASGAFRHVDPVMTASLIKPLLQDWYLKRWKYRRRSIGPDDYADWVISFVQSFLTHRGLAGQ
jgi:AcrR family transcriptional regulator